MGRNFCPEDQDRIPDAKATEVGSPWLTVSTAPTTGEKPGRRSIECSLIKVHSRCAMDQKGGDSDYDRVAKARSFSFTEDWGARDG